jgi:hypothetical protein
MSVLLRIAEEIGAKVTFSRSCWCNIDLNHVFQVSNLFHVPSTTSHASFLVRLPPPSINLTPEVRCAVVGNVELVQCRGVEVNLT